MMSISHADGSGEYITDVRMLSDLYDELRGQDPEHGDVAVTHEESGWTISAHCDGRVVLENLETGGERHMMPVPKEEVLALWTLLVEGELDSIFARPWRVGYVESGRDVGGP